MVLQDLGCPVGAIWIFNLVPEFVVLYEPLESGGGPSVDVEELGGCGEFELFGTEDSLGIPFRDGGCWPEGLVPPLAFLRPVKLPVAIPDGERSHSASI